MRQLVQCSLGVLTVLGILGFALLVGAIHVLIEAWVLQRNRGHVLGPLAVEICVLVEMVSIVVAAFDQSPVKNLVWEHEALLARQPAALTIALLTVALLVLAAAGRDLRRIRRGHLTRDSVQEAVDELPDGVCFFGDDGRPLLVNARMNELAHQLTGAALTDARAFWELLCARGEHRAPSEGAGDVVLVADGEGSSWELHRSMRVTPSGPITELTATEVTRELALIDELEHRNQQLSAVNERLRAYGADLARLTREEEILAAKVRVHGEVGRALVALRVYERQDPVDRDRDSLLRLWRRATHLLEMAAEPEAPVDRWRLLEEAAMAVDVRLVLTGEPPRTGTACEVLTSVVHECLNNAVRHAGAHELRVDVRRTGCQLVARITNDGAPPQGPSQETGGLADMRALVERTHGTMGVAWSPVMVVTIGLDAEES